MSGLEETLALQMLADELPPPIRQHKFHPVRQWRFDFAWPAVQLAAEVEGGTHSGGRHVRGDGFQADCDKYNAATVRGWRILRFTAEDVMGGVAVRTIARCLAGAWSLEEQGR